MKRETRRYGIAFAVLLVLLGGLLIWNLNAGSFPMTPRRCWRSSSDKGEMRRPAGSFGISVCRGFWGRRFWAAHCRFPAFTADIFRQSHCQPLCAGDFLRGQTDRGTDYDFSPPAGILSNSFVLIGSAFVGAMLSMGFVLLVSQKIRRMSVLVICGIMVGYICSAVTDFAVTFAEDANIVNLHNWSVGSFSGITWSNLGVIAGTVGLAVLWAFCLSKPMGAYQLGESYAQSVGVSIRRFRVELILLSSVLSACVTAFAGPISFVGIAVPHLVRTLMGTSKPILVIPGCFLGGAVFCLFCDLVARTVFAPVEMSISSVTALFGAPIVIYMMVRRQSKAM